MGAFKWKKVWIPVGNGQVKKIRINRLSNYQLYKFIFSKYEVWIKIRMHFNPAFKQARYLAQKRGIIEDARRKLIFG